MHKTAEAVSLGHPDKTSDYISSYILERLCSQYGAKKLHEAMIAAKTKPAVASRRFNVR